MCFIEPIKELKSQGKQLDGYQWNDKCHQRDTGYKYWPTRERAWGEETHDIKTNLDKIFNELLKAEWKYKILRTLIQGEFKHKHRLLPTDLQ